MRADADKQVASAKYYINIFRVTQRGGFLLRQLAVWTGPGRSAASLCDLLRVFDFGLVDTELAVYPEDIGLALGYPEESLYGQ